MDEVGLTTAERFSSTTLISSKTLSEVNAGDALIARA